MVVAVAIQLRLEWRMAKPKPQAEVEAQVVLMRKIAPERFEVLTGTLRGSLSDVKVLERNVSITVGRGTARKALDEQKRKESAAFGLEGGN